MQTAHGGYPALSVVRRCQGAKYGWQEQMTNTNERNVTMMTFVSNFAAAARKRAAYNRTVAELRALPIDTALDLDIYRGDARRIAELAVYGA